MDGLRTRDRGTGRKEGGRGDETNEIYNTQGKEGRRGGKSVKMKGLVGEGRGRRRRKSSEG